MRELPHAKARTTTGLVMIMIGVLPVNGQAVFVNLIFGQMLLLLYRVPVSFLYRKIKPILPFIGFTLLFFPIYEGAEGVLKAAIYIGRLLFVAQMLAFMLFKTPLPVFLKSLQALKVPNIFIELILFTLRFFDVFKREFNQMRLSLKSRSFFSGSLFSMSKYRTIGKMIGIMLMRSLQRAERIYLGMASRGYTGESFLDDEKVPNSNWRGISVYVLLLIVLNLVTGRG
jgi:cobalt/nickel transport system permease protein